VDGRYAGAVRGFCGKGKQRKRCIKTRAKGFTVRFVKRTTYRATATRVPRGRATIRVRVADAGGKRRLLRGGCGFR
jgi:hypothetical protein